MPKVKDTAGNIVAELPYTAKGEEMAQDMANENPSLKIDYGENNVTDAPMMRETYELGGRIPGDPLFGQRPAINSNVGIQGGGVGEGIQLPPVLADEWPEPGPGDKFHDDQNLLESGQATGMYKKGGKVKYKK